MSEDLPPQKSEPVKTTLFTPSLYGGRFTKKQYFLHMLVGIVVLFCITLSVELTMNSYPNERDAIIPIIDVISVILTMSYPNEGEMVLFAIITIIDVLFFIPITLKRAHDCGDSGRFLVTMYIIGLVLAPASSFIRLVYLLNSFMLLFTDSEKNSNIYGPYQAS